MKRRLLLAIAILLFAIAGIVILVIWAGNGGLTNNATLLFDLLLAAGLASFAAALYP